MQTCACEKPDDSIMLPGTSEWCSSAALEFALRSTVQALTLAATKSIPNSDSVNQHDL